MVGPHEYPTSIIPYSHPTVLPTQSTIVTTTQTISTPLPTLSSNVKIVKNDPEKMSVEVGSYYFSTYCRDGGSCTLSIPITVKNIGNTLTDQSYMHFILWDYARKYRGGLLFELDSSASGVDKMYPGDTKNSTLEYDLGYNPDIFNKMVSHDLTLEGRFGQDTATWTISTAAVQV